MAFDNCRSLTTIVIPRGALDAQPMARPLIDLGYLALYGWRGTFKEVD